MGRATWAVMQRWIWLRDRVTERQYRVPPNGTCGMARLVVAGEALVESKLGWQTVRHWIQSAISVIVSASNGWSGGPVADWKR
jgi:hypothetical protein